MTHKTYRSSFAVMCTFVHIDVHIETSQIDVDLANFFPQPSVQVTNMPINFFFFHRTYTAREVACQTDTLFYQR